MIAGGDKTWARLDTAVRDLERMAVSIDVVEQLLGLPIEPLRAAARVRKVKADTLTAQRKAEREAKEAQDVLSVSPMKRRLERWCILI